MTSCYVVDDQRIVELWKNYSEPPKVTVYDDDDDDHSDLEEGDLESQYHGNVEIFGFCGEAIVEKLSRSSDLNGTLHLLMNFKTTSKTRNAKLMKQR